MKDLRPTSFAMALILGLSVLMFPSSGFTEGSCIKLKNGKLSAKATNNNSCPSGQAFIAKVAGATGATGVTGETGATGATGSTGASGADGSARGYGFVSSAGNLDTARSSGNVSARKVATGVYCISATGVSPTAVMPIITADQDDGSGNFHVAQLKSLFGGVFGCTASEWGVSTYQIVSNTQSATDIAFSFLIP